MKTMTLKYSETSLTAANSGSPNNSPHNHYSMEIPCLNERSIFDAKLTDPHFGTHPCWIVGLVANNSSGCAFAPLGKRRTNEMGSIARGAVNTQPNKYWTSNFFDLSLAPGHTDNLDTNLDDIIETQFCHLARVWKQSRRPHSSAIALADSREYRQIISLGERVIPFILRELQKKPDHWFIALNTISGEDPVPPAAAGRLKEMANAWLDWGRKKGYL